MGTLYLVATPIGNLQDLSPRAAETLRRAHVVAAEDTRHTRKLLSAASIPAPRLISYYEPDEKEQAQALAAELDAGRHVALVTDAGTPGISDPGYRIVCLAVEKGHRVVPIPGPSAALALLSVSGLPTDRFLFAGFPPQKGGPRKKFFEDLSLERATVLFHESPVRLGETLGEMAEVFGPARRVVIGRELTKIHEEISRGTLEEMARRFAKEPVVGEVTIALEGDREKRIEPSAEILEAEIKEALEVKGLSVRDVSDRLAKKYGVPRKRIYRMALGQSGPAPGLPPGLSKDSAEDEPPTP